MPPTAAATISHARDCECPHCGLFQFLPPLPPNAEAKCVRCDATLRRRRTNATTYVLALSLTSLVLYLIAVSTPFLFVDIVGKQRQTTMLSLPIAFWQDGTWELAAVVTVTAIIMPLLKIAITILVVGGLRTERPPAFLPGLFKWYERIGPWAMVEVFLLGVFVAFTRLGAIATVEVGEALYAIAALMLTMVLADFLLDPAEIWAEMERRRLVPPPSRTAPRGERIACLTCSRVNDRAEGERCLRCNSVLHARKPNSVLNTWAFLAAGLLLYIPANLFPILTLVRLGQPNTSTILGGAQELLDAGMWPLALLVFVASLMVPVLKLIGLAVMLIATHRGTAWRLRDRTRLYRLIEFIGRWSMIDIFMLSTLVGLVRAGNLATVTPQLGAICFASVVVLTMFGAACFDPRLMWDAAPPEEQAARMPALPPARTVSAGSQPGTA